jgi:hypothetical protein
MDLNHRPPGPEPGALARLRYAPTDTLRPNFRPKQDSQINIASRSRARQLYLRAISLLVGLLIANRYWDLVQDAAHHKNRTDSFPRGRSSYEFNP